LGDGIDSDRLHGLRFGEQTESLAAFAEMGEHGVVSLKDSIVDKCGLFVGTLLSPKVGTRRCRVSGGDSGYQILLLPLAGAVRQGGCPKEVFSMRSYELMMIHRYDMVETDVRAAVAEVEKAITDRNGVVIDTDFWGKRRFAYEIDHMTEGYYSVVTFDGDVELQSNLDRSLSLLDSVVRHKVMKPSS